MSLDYSYLEHVGSQKGYEVQYGCAFRCLAQTKSHRSSPCYQTANGCGVSVLRISYANTSRKAVKNNIQRSHLLAKNDKLLQRWVDS
jgi:hypothetical protein